MNFLQGLQSIFSPSKAAVDEEPARASSPARAVHTGTADTDLTNASVSTTNSLKDMKFLELRSLLKQKGIKYKRTDTKEMLLQALQSIQEEEDSIKSTDSPQVKERKIGTPPTAQSQVSNVSLLHNERRPAAKKYSLRSSDIHYNLRHNELHLNTSTSPSSGRISRSGRMSSSNNEVIGHNIDDDFVHDPVTNSHVKRKHHRKSMSPVRQEDKDALAATVSSSSAVGIAGASPAARTPSLARRSQSTASGSTQRFVSSSSKNARGMATPTSVRSAARTPAKRVEPDPKPDDEDSELHSADITDEEEEVLEDLLNSNTQPLPSHQEMMTVEDEPAVVSTADDAEPAENIEDDASVEDLQEDRPGDADPLDNGENDHSEESSGDEQEEGPSDADPLDSNEDGNVVDNEEEPEDQGSEEEGEGESEEDEDDEKNWEDIEEEEEDEGSEQEEQVENSEDNSEESQDSEESDDEEEEGDDESEDDEEVSEDEEERTGKGFTADEPMDLISDDEEEEVKPAPQPVKALEKTPAKPVFHFSAPTPSGASTASKSTTPAASALAALVASVTPKPHEQTPPFHFTAPTAVAPVAVSGPATPAPTTTAPSSAVESVFKKLGSLVASNDGALSEKDYELIMACLERAKPASLAAKTTASVAAAPSAPAPTASGTVAAVAAPASKPTAAAEPTPTVRFQEPENTPKSANTSVSGSAKPGAKTLSFAALDVTIPEKDSLYPTVNFFTSPFCSPTFTPGTSAVKPAITVNTALPETSGFGSRRLLLTPYNKSRQSVDSAASVASHQSSSLVNRLPTPHHSKQSAHFPPDTPTETFQSSTKKRSFFDADPQESDPHSFLYTSASKRMSIDSRRNSLEDASYRLISGTNVSSPIQDHTAGSPVGSGVVGPLTSSSSSASSASSLVLPPSAHNPPAAATPFASRLPVPASRSSYLPVFRAASSQFTSFPVPVVSGDVVARPPSNPTAAAPKLSYLQRRRLERQSEGTVNAVVAKKIIETLGSAITSNIEEQQKKKPIAPQLSWRDSKVTAEDVSPSRVEQQKKVDLPVTKAATITSFPLIGNSLAVEAPKKEVFSFGQGPLVAPQLSQPAPEKIDAVPAVKSASVAEKPKSAEGSTFGISSFSTAAPAVAVPAKSPFASVNKAIAAGTLPPSAAKAAMATLQDGEFVFEEPQDLDGITEEFGLGKRSSLLSPGGVSSGASSGIKYAFSPPNKSRRTSLSASTAATPLKASAPVTVPAAAGATAKAPAPAVQEPPANSIWSTASINDGVKCSVCLSKNKKGATRCAACESPLDGSEKPAAPAPAVAAAPAAAKIDPPANSIWSTAAINDGVKCPVCLSKNKKGASKCAACESPLEGGSAGADKKDSGAASSSGFTFGAAPAPATTSDAPKFIFGSTPANPITETKTAASGTGFTFGAPAADAKKSESAPASGGFTFGAPAASTETKKADAAPVPSSGGFTFGGPAAASTETKKAESTSSSAPFTFGAPASTAASSGSAAPFTFGSAPAASETKKVDAAPAFGSGAAGFTFGKPATVSTTDSNAPKTEPSKAKVSFGQLEEKEDAEEQPKKRSAAFSFGASADTKNDGPSAAAPAPKLEFAFPGAASTSSQPVSKGTASFNWNATPSESSKSLPSFSFGASAATPAPAAAPAVESKPAAVSFGGTPLTSIPETKPAAAVEPKPFLFGSAPPVSTTVPAADTFSFSKPPIHNSGSSNSLASGSFGVADVPTPPASATAAAAPVLTFGSQPAEAAKPFTFGSTPAAAPASAAAAAPFTFGSSPAAAASTTPSAAPFMFGSSAPTAAAPTASSASAAAPFMFGASKPATTTPPATAAAAPAFSFGAAAPTASAPAPAASPFTFGGPSTATNSNPFGGASGSNGGMDMSSNSTAPGLLPPSTLSAPAFGGFGGSTPAFGSASAAPTAGGMFGSQPSTAFGAPAAAAPAVGNPFASSAFGAGASGGFGGAGSLPSTTSSTPAFGFPAGAAAPFGGGAAANPFGGAPSGPFGAASAPRTTPNMFGGSTPTPTNFGSTTPVNFGAPASFGPPAGGMGGGDGGGFSLGAADKQQGANVAGRRKVRAKRPGQ